jgi:hypothetical protein
MFLHARAFYSGIDALIVLVSTLSLLQRGGNSTLGGEFAMHLHKNMVQLGSTSPSPELFIFQGSPTETDFARSLLHVAVPWILPSTLDTETEIICTVHVVLSFPKLC